MSDNLSLDLPDYRSTLNALNARLEELVVNSDLVLDVGCGGQTNIFTSKDVCITGCDIDEEALKRNQKIKDYKICTAEELPFESSKFKVVMSFDVLEHLEDPQAFARRAFDVLEPGGYFVAVTPNLNSLFGVVAANAPLSFLRFGSKLLTGSETENEVHYYRMNTRDDSRKILLDAGFQDPATIYLNRLPSKQRLRYVLYPYYQLCRMSWASKFSSSLLFVGQKPS